MDNRVDYLSDRMVNLRGKHKSVHEVIPPDSIVNGVSVRPATAQKNVAATAAAPAVDILQERRREQVMQLYSDFEQRLIRRQKQISLRINELEAVSSKLQSISGIMHQQYERLKSEAVDLQDTMTPSELGSRYRAIDRERLDFFELDAELEMMLTDGTANLSLVENRKNHADTGDFKFMLKKGAAYALTAGLTVAAAILLAAVIIFSAWR